MTRKLIAVTPLLLICGIVAQAILLVIAILLYVPCVIWPGILDRPYRWITKSMARIFAKSIIGKRREAIVITSLNELSFRDWTRSVKCLSSGVSLCYDEMTSPKSQEAQWIESR